MIKTVKSLFRVKKKENLQWLLIVTRTKSKLLNLA